MARQRGRRGPWATTTTTTPSLAAGGAAALPLPVPHAGLLGRAGDWLLDRAPRATMLGKLDEKDSFASDQERRIAGLIHAAGGEKAVQHWLTEALSAAARMRAGLASETFEEKVTLAAAEECKRNLTRAYRAAPVGARPHAIAAAIHQHALGLDDQDKHRIEGLSRRAFGQADRGERATRLWQMADRTVDAFADTPELQILLGLGVLVAKAAHASQQDVRERAARYLQYTIYVLAERGLAVIPEGAANPFWPAPPGGVPGLAPRQGGGNPTPPSLAGMGGVSGPLVPVGQPMTIPGTTKLGTLALPASGAPAIPFPAAAAPAPRSPVTTKLAPAPPSGGRGGGPGGDTALAAVRPLFAAINPHVAATLEAAAVNLDAPPSEARRRAAARQLAQVETYGLGLQQPRIARDGSDLPARPGKDPDKAQLVLATVDGLRELAYDRTRAFERIRAAQIVFNQRSNPRQHPEVRAAAPIVPPPVTRTLPGEPAGRRNQHRRRDPGDRGNR